MLGMDWLPQNPNLAVQLGQMRTERQRPCVVPVDVLEGIWGFDEFPPAPGSLTISHWLRVYSSSMLHGCSRVLGKWRSCLKMCT